MRYLFLFLSLLLISCKGKNSSSIPTQDMEGDTLAVQYATGFSVIDYNDFKVLEVTNPFPEADHSYTYLLLERGQSIPKDLDYDELVYTPIKKIVTTSTTHIPALEALGEENSLVGFPHPNYISSPKTRQRIDDKKVADIGENERINIEILLSLQPDVMIGFGMKEENKVYSNISQSGIPVILNGDWNEKSPLGKAEWVKFFGALYDKDAEAEKWFHKIEDAYQEAKALGEQAKEKPSVMAGSMLQDVWYVPAGESWAAQFLEDAHTNYLYKNTKGSGSLSLSFEKVLEKAQDADFWIAPSGYTSYTKLKKGSPHYTQFEAFKNKKIYTYETNIGATGGVLYFELGPNRPDLILKDLIHIFHPEILPDYKPTFYKSLE